MTVVEQSREIMRIAREEVFGPVMVIERAHDADEALDVQHRSPYGNAASVFTESGGVNESKWNREAGVNWMS